MSANLQAYQRYKTTSVQTASPDRLLIMLYDGLIAKLEMSKEAILAQRYDEASTQLGKSQEIVMELRNTLKMEYEISHALAALYDWFYRQMVQANIKKSVQPIDDILPRIKELREAWVQASMKLRASAATATGSEG